MRRILHITTREEDALARSMRGLQTEAGHDVVCIDLSVVALDTEADYSVLVEEIFKADSVQVW